MYTIKQAAARSGVGISLLRAWERRYGVVHPVRTAGGYRLYDDEAIARLRAMRQLIEAGWSASQAASAVLDEPADRVGLSGSQAAGRGPETHATASPEATAPEDDLTAAFVGAAGRYDGAAIERSLDEMFGRGSLEATLEGHVLPALRALGDAWAAGTLDVAAEHLASAAVVRRLAARFDLSGAPGSGPRVLVGLPPGCRHEIGPLAFAIAGRRRGLDVLYLGPDVPVPSWVDAATSSEAAAAVIGVARRADVERARDVAAALQDARPALIVAFGGPAAAQAAIDLGTLILPDRVADAAAVLAEQLHALA
jgi:DNA-binding transcriptional MerR regulator